MSINSPVPFNTSFGAYAVIEESAHIGEGCQIGAHAVVKAGTRLAANVQVGEHCVLGGLPQDLKFDPTIESYVDVGEGTVLREGVTLNRATRVGGATVIGARCYLMANSHVGHDSVLGDHVVLANGVLLGGHVSVGDHTFIGGNAGVHQHVRIGESAMLSGGGRYSTDIPPFVIAAERNEAHGLNLVGLRRRGFSSETLTELKRLYAEVYRQCGGEAQRARAIRASGGARTPEGQRFLEFFVEGNRGYVQRKA